MVSHIQVLGILVTALSLQPTNTQMVYSWLRIQISLMLVTQLIYMTFTLKLMPLPVISLSLKLMSVTLLQSTITLLIYIRFTLKLMPMLDLAEATLILYIMLVLLPDLGYLRNLREFAISHSSLAAAILSGAQISSEQALANAIPYLALFLGHIMRQEYMPIHCASSRGQLVNPLSIQCASSRGQLVESVSR